MEIIKISYNNEIRRIALKSLTFETLIEKINEIYPDIGKSLKVTWVDDENDVIILSTTNEFIDSLNCMKAMGLSTCKYVITSINTNNDIKSNQSKSSNDNFENQSIHRGVTCDECGLSPIKGIRYKCVVRENYDICEHCEKSKQQMYPLIKIYSPDQAPLAIVVAIRDHHRGHRGGGGKCFRGGGRRFNPESTDNIPTGIPLFNGQQCGRWARNAAKAFVQAVDSVVEPIQNELLSKNTKESNDIEQKFVDEAIRLSTNSVPNYKGRYIRDITFPDGTCIPPNTAFEKIWLIRNDGTIDWANGTVLIPTEGDQLCDSSKQVIVPSLKAGEEGDITIQLVSPGTSGRFTSNFRLKSPDGSIFGQRLWVDIVVLEEDIDWTLINNALPVNQTLDTSSTLGGSISDNSVTNSITNSIANSVDNSVAYSISKEIPDSSANSLKVSSNWGKAIDMEDSIFSSNQSIESISAEEIAWSNELTILRDIGFNDKNFVIPLLVKHLKNPITINGLAQPDPVALQRVVMELLGQSLSGY
mmetsp:Transcript_10101/g.9052  ORF Transcript_10101/g.9052 Transcript_10101/m.9052 type:complete len:529 (-) Transcript_10101:103-1689(-)